jgi:hypothetical protein
VDALFGGTDNDTFLFDVAISDLDVIFDGTFGTLGRGVADIIRIANAPEAINDFTELMGHAYQDGSDVVIGFDADTGIYIKNYTIAQLAPDDVVFA